MESLSRQANSIHFKPLASEIGRCLAMQAGREFRLSSGYASHKRG